MTAHRRPYNPEPWRLLAAAILLRAVRDVEAGNGASDAARRWLVGDPLAGVLLDALDLDRGRVAAAVGGVPS